MIRKNTDHSSRTDDVNRPQKYYDDEHLHEILDLVQEEDVEYVYDYDDDNHNQHKALRADAGDHMDQYDDNYRGYEDYHMNEQDRELAQDPDQDWGQDRELHQDQELDQEPEQNQRYSSKRVPERKFRQSCDDDVKIQKPRRSRDCCGDSEVYQKTDTSLKNMARRLEEIMAYSNPVHRLEPSRESEVDRSVKHRHHRDIERTAPRVDELIIESPVVDERKRTDIVIAIEPIESIESITPPDPCETGSYFNNLVCKTKRYFTRDESMKMMKPVQQPIKVVKDPTPVPKQQSIIVPKQSLAVKKPEHIKKPVKVVQETEIKVDTYISPSQRAYLEVYGR